MSHRHSKYNKEKSAFKDADCYGFACSNKASDLLIISAGRFGEVELHLCSICQRKFVEKTKDENSHQSPIEEIQSGRQPIVISSPQLSSNAINVEDCHKSKIIERGGLSVNDSCR
ncbi:MAG TPA: hypothetical protein VFG45_03440 [Candidatus Nitrosocosmicus sp.]|nr:hypothetical protein [Candidatus Nitrosocosmicus sp.]